MMGKVVRGREVGGEGKRGKLGFINGGVWETGGWGGKPKEKRERGLLGREGFCL